MIYIYIPIYNNAVWCENFSPLPGFCYVASDNASIDGSGDILRSKGVEVIKQPTNLGRIGNWKFCVAHFINSDATWMKWLFAGDELLPDIYKKLERAINANPQARLIVGEYEIVEKGLNSHWKMFSETRLILPEEAMYLAAERGNWFGSPIGHCIHREAFINGFDFGNLEWIADMQFCVGIAVNYPVLYLTEILGKFHMAERKYYMAHIQSVFSCVEGALVRRDAAERYRKLTGNDDKFHELMKLIEKNIETSLILRVCKDWSKPDLMQEAIIDAIPTKNIPKIFLKRVITRLLGRKS